MKSFIYEVDKEPIYPDKTKYRVKFKRKRTFLWLTWYSYQGKYKYIDRRNRACQREDAFTTTSKDEIDSFLTWVQRLDGTC